MGTNGTPSDPDAARSLADRPAPPAADVRTFLIADVRGYTSYTQENGDEAAGELAAGFAGLAREVVEAGGGELLELRGDEALSVFGSARQALRAAVELQARFRAHEDGVPVFPLGIGIGLDAGEAVPIEGGYRGGALNLAARLCSITRPGEILASETVVSLARRIDGARFVPRRAVRLKGLASPVRVVEVVSETPLPPLPPRPRPRLFPRRDRRPTERLRVPPGLRRKRVAVLALGSALVLAAAITVAVVSVAGGDESSELAAVAPNSLAVIDARTNTVLGGIPVGIVPSSIAVGEGAVWVLNGDDKTVSRMDPYLKKVLRTVAVGGTPTDLAVGAGAVWVVNGFDNTVTRIDAQSNVVVETIRLPTSGELPPVSIGTSGHIAVGGEAVWVTSLLQHGFVWRVDPKTNAVAATIRLPRGAGGGEIAFGEGAVWVNGNGGITRIDASTYSRTLLSAVQPGGTGGIAVGGGAVWVAGLSTGSEQEILWRIDPRGEYATASIAVGAGPAGVAVGAGSIWVANGFDGTLSRVNPETNEVEKTITVGSAPRDVAVGAGTVWVTVG